VKIEWILSAELTEKLRPLVEEAIRIAPLFVTKLTVRLDPGLESPIAIIVKHEYRLAVLDFGPSFLINSDAEQSRMLFEEMIHAHIAPMYQVFKALLEATTKEETALHAWAEEQWRIAEEGCANELSEILQEPLTG
jgi:hypothetical protein